MTTTDLIRFQAKYVVDPWIGCWIWLGARDYKGYARFNFEGANRRAHRISYQHYVGPIPRGLTIDHLCRVRHCVNPNHLQAVPMRINMLRGQSPTAIGFRRGMCPRGHPYAIVRSGVHMGRHICNPCKNANKRFHRMRNSIKKVAVTHCPQGHVYDLFNTYYRKDYPGRNCRTCGREKQRERRQEAV